MIINCIYGKFTQVQLIVEYIMQNRINIMRKMRMPTVHQNKQRKDMSRVALIKRVEETEKQLIVGESNKKQSPLVEGKFVIYNSENRFSMHGGNCLELVDSEVVATAQASMIITILLSGSLSVSYDNLKLDLNSNESPKGAIVNLSTPACFRKTITRGNQLSKLHIMISPIWIKQHTALDCTLHSFSNTDQSHQLLKVTPEIITLVEKILALPNNNDFISSLQKETLAQQLIFDVLKQLSPEMLGNSESEKQPLDDKVSASIHYIESHLDDEISLDLLADKMAMSVSNLQRKFKQDLGVTVSSYIRQRRLEIAKVHIERGTMTITEAAYESGYHHPSNFSNAFKKLFGISPKELYEQHTTIKNKALV